MLQQQSLETAVSAKRVDRVPASPQRTGTLDTTEGVEPRPSALDVRSLEALRKKLPVNWIFGWTHNTLVPHAKLMRSIERFYTEVLPRVS